MAFVPRGRAATIKVPTEYWYEVQIDVPSPPPRGARLVFGLVNGDVRIDNHAVVRNLVVDGHLGAAVTTRGTAAALEGGGFRLEDRPFYVSKWIQQDVSIQSHISFQLVVTKEYPFKKKDPFQPDQFSFAEP